VQGQTQGNGDRTPPAPLLHEYHFDVLLHLHHTFYHTRYASMAYAVILCPSVTSRSSIKIAKPSITQTTPYDSPGTVAASQKGKGSRGSFKLLR